MLTRTPPPPAEGNTESRTPVRARRRWSVLAMAVVLALGAAALGWRFALAPREVPPPAPVVTLTAVVGLGWVEPTGTVLRVGAPGNPDSSRVAVLAVEEGDRVAAGQLLATLDNAAQRIAQVNQSEAQLRLRRVQLARQRADQVNLLAARAAAAERAQAELSLAAAEQERLRSLVATNATSRSTYDRAVRDLALAAATRREAEAALVRSAVAHDGVAIDVAIAEAELGAAEADLALAHTALELAFIRAPAAGVVIALKARPGERVGSDGLLEFGGTDRMRAVVEVYQTDIGRVRVGQAVTLRADALETPLTGVVERLGRAVRRQTIINADPATATDARVVPVIVALPLEEGARVATLSRLQITAVFAR